MPSPARSDRNSSVAVLRSIGRLDTIGWMEADLRVVICPCT